MGGHFSPQIRLLGALQTPKMGLFCHTRQNTRPRILEFAPAHYPCLPFADCTNPCMRSEAYFFCITQSTRMYASLGLLEKLAHSKHLLVCGAFAIQLGAHLPPRPEGDRAMQPHGVLLFLDGLHHRIAMPQIQGMVKCRVT